MSKNTGKVIQVVGVVVDVEFDGDVQQIEGAIRRILILGARRLERASLLGKRGDRERCHGQGD